MFPTQFPEEPNSSIFKRRDTERRAPTASDGITQPEGCGYNFEFPIHQDMGEHKGSPLHFISHREFDLKYLARIGWIFLLLPSVPVSPELLPL